MSKTKQTTTLPSGVVPNSFNVPTRHWNKWAKEAQAMFNRVYGEVVSNQSVIAPPSGATLSPRAWQVICWNIMWLATDEANTFLRK